MSVLLPPWMVRPTAAVLAPLLAGQGAQVRRRTPVLPEPPGPRDGVTGTGPLLALLVVGESTAAGVGARGQHEGLAARLADELGRRAHRTVAWRAVARSGVSAREAHRELVPTARSRSADVTIVVLGVNDTLRLRAPARWRADVAAIVTDLERAAAPGATTLLAGVPDLAGFPALPAPLRTVLGAHARTLDRELGHLARGQRTVHHVPLPRFGPEVFAQDGFHPGAAGYRTWATQLADTALPRLAPPSR